jgi:toxin ParE1/3/4
MKGIIIAPEAYADLEDYYEFIAQSSSTAALRFFDAARQTFAQIARFPEIGAVYTATAVSQDLRKWHIKGFRKYLIFYRVRDESITIVRIIYAARNVDQVIDR